MKNIIFIDWDDTLFPTSWINNNKIDCTNKEDINKYKLFFLELDKSITNLLEIITDNNNNLVYIVTNANKKWVEICLSVLPKTSSIIKKDVIIISAKDKYNQKTNSIVDWKILTFKDVINDVYINNMSDSLNQNISDSLNQNMYAPITMTEPIHIIRSNGSNSINGSNGINGSNSINGLNGINQFIGNIISIGDSNYEYTALVKLYEYLKNNGFKLYNTSKKKEKEFLLKNIKLIDKPEFDILINELYALKKNINIIIEQKDIVDVLLEP